jgi:hypothetical protein
VNNAREAEKSFFYFHARPAAVLVISHVKHAGVQDRLNAVPAVEENIQRIARIAKAEERDNVLIARVLALPSELK